MCFAALRVASELEHLDLLPSCGESLWHLHCATVPQPIPPDERLQMALRECH